MTLTKTTNCTIYSPHSCDPVLGPAAAVWHFSSPESQYFFSLKRCLANSEMIRERALNLWEVHGISGPVVHQFVEVIGKGSFPLVGGWHVRGETLGTPLALTQTRTTHRICAIRPCRRRRGRGGKETQLRVFVFRINFDKSSEWMRMMFLF